MLNKKIQLYTIYCTPVWTNIYSVSNFIFYGHTLFYINIFLRLDEYTPLLVNPFQINWCSLLINPACSGTIDDRQHVISHVLLFYWGTCELLSPNYILLSTYRILLSIPLNTTYYHTIFFICRIYYYTIYSFQLYTTYTPFNILYTHCSKIYFFLESMIYSFPNNILYIVLQKILYSVFQITYILFSKLCNSAYSNQKYTTVSKKKEKRSVQEIPKKVQEIFGPARTPHQNILSFHGDAFSRPRK